VAFAPPRSGRAARRGNYAACGVLAALSLLAAPSLKAQTTKGYDVGSVVADFSLNDLEGRKKSLKDLAEGKKYVVVCFWSRECEPTRAAETRLQKLYSDYATKGVAFVRLVSNKRENKAEDDVKKTQDEAKNRKIEWTMLLDVDNKIADAFDAKVTPDFYVLDAKELKVVYEGALTDDKWKSEKVVREYVKESLDLLLEGKPLATTTVAAEGTSIKRV
jgi:thiol-disulfide isomerase/thioredoxin